MRNLRDLVLDDLTGRLLDILLNPLHIAQGCINSGYHTNPEVTR